MTKKKKKQRFECPRELHQFIIENNQELKIKIYLPLELLKYAQARAKANGMEFAAWLNFYIVEILRKDIERGYYTNGK